MLIAVDEDTLKALFTVVERIEQKFDNQQKTDVFEMVMTHADAAKYLKMSERHLHNLKGYEIAYSAYGKKLTYQKKDLDDFLNRNRIECTKK